MSFTVRFRGVDIQCETVEDAIQIASRLSDDGTAVPVPGKPEAGGSLEVSRYKELVGSMNQTQKKFLTLLIENPHGKTDKAIRQELGLGNNKAIGGILSVLARSAKKVGIGIDMIVQSEKKKVGDEQLKEFRIRPEFRKIALDVGGLK